MSHLNVKELKDKLSKFRNKRNYLEKNYTPENVKKLEIIYKKIQLINSLIIQKQKGGGLFKKKINNDENFNSGIDIVDSDKKQIIYDIQPVVENFKKTHKKEFINLDPELKIEQVEKAIEKKEEKIFQNNKENIFENKEEKVIESEKNQKIEKNMEKDLELIKVNNLDKIEGNKTPEIKQVKQEDKNYLSFYTMQTFTNRKSLEPVDISPEDFKKIPQILHVLISAKDWNQFVKILQGIMVEKSKFFKVDIFKKYNQNALLLLMVLIKNYL